MANRVEQARITTSQTTIVPSQGVTELALFDTQDNPLVVPKKLAAIGDISTADATDEASAVTLANANKAKINALLQALRDAGLLAS